MRINDVHVSTSSMMQWLTDCSNSFTKKDKRIFIDCWRVHYQLIFIIYQRQYVEWIQSKTNFRDVKPQENTNIVTHIPILRLHFYWKVSKIQSSLDVPLYKPQLISTWIKTDNVLSILQSCDTKWCEQYLMFTIFTDPICCLIVSTIDFMKFQR